MTTMHRTALKMALALGILLAASCTGLEAADRPIEIGVVSTVFRDIPDTGVKLVLRKFTELIRTQTGLEANLQVAGSEIELSAALNKGKYDLAVFHGHEFAWARERISDLQPVLIAVNRQRELHAYLVVRKDSAVAPAGNIKGLNGKVLVQPWRCREFARLFVQRRCLEADKLPEQLFKSINEAGCVEAALDQVVDRDADAAIVDGIGLDVYSTIKPARFAGLQILLASETFPASVLACRKGALTEKELTMFREGMLAANQCKKGQDLLKWCQITSFETIPDNYEQLLSEILKAYPCPEEPTKK